MSNPLGAIVRKVDSALARWLSRELEKNEANETSERWLRFEMWRQTVDLWFATDDGQHPIHGRR